MTKRIEISSKVKSGRYYTAKLNEENVKLATAILSGRAGMFALDKLTYISDSRTAIALLHAYTFFHSIGLAYRKDIMDMNGVRSDNHYAIRTKTEIRNAGLVYCQKLWPVMFPKHKDAFSANALPRLFTDTPRRTVTIQAAREFFRHATPLVYGHRGSAESILLRPLFEAIANHCLVLEDPEVFAYTPPKNYNLDGVTEWVNTIRPETRGPAIRQVTIPYKVTVPGKYLDLIIQTAPRIDIIPVGKVKALTLLIQKETLISVGGATFITPDEIDLVHPKEINYEALSQIIGD